MFGFECNYASDFSIFVYSRLFEVYSRVSLRLKARNESNQVDMQTKAVIISVILFFTEIHTLIYVGNNFV